MEIWKELKAFVSKGLIEAGWAPIGVLIFHELARLIGWLESLDWLMHFMGGFTIAFFLFRSVTNGSYFLGQLKPLAIYLFSFSLACTAAVFWEFAEWSADFFVGTHIQKGLTETMKDLLFGVFGATLLLLLILGFSLIRKNNIE